MDSQNEADELRLILNAWKGNCEAAEQRLAEETKTLVLVRRERDQARTYLERGVALMPAETIGRRNWAACAMAIVRGGKS